MEPYVNLSWFKSLVTEIYILFNLLQINIPNQIFWRHLLANFHNEQKVQGKKKIITYNTHIKSSLKTSFVYVVLSLRNT